MPIATGLIVAGIAGVVGAGIQANAAGNAADTQSNSAAAASRVSQQQFNRTRTDLEPFLRTGVAANQTLGNLLGIGGPADGSGPLTAQQVSQIYQRYMGRPVQAPEMSAILAQHQTAADLEQAVSQSPEYGQHVNAQGNVSQVQQPLFSATSGAGNNAQTGSLLTPFTGASVATDPGYQFGLQQGQDAVNQRASASGMRLSPATLKALSRFTQDYAGTKFGDAFSRDLSTKQFTYNALSGLSDQGRGAANSIGALGQNMATQVGENIMGAGNVQGAGTVATANAWGGALNNSGNQFVNYAMLDKFLQGRSPAADPNAFYSPYNYGYSGSTGLSTEY